MESQFSLLMDVPLEITAELGTCTMPVAQILKLGNGSVVRLDRTVSEALDLFVNGRRIARGEIVAIDDNLGIRITEVLK
jgi:flagellar motor switch protein FliN/FliY